MVLPDGPLRAGGHFVAGIPFRGRVGCFGAPFGRDQDYPNADSVTGHDVASDGVGVSRYS
jgi:hypothetical protein